MRNYYYLLVHLHQSTASPYQSLDILNISQAPTQHLPSKTPEQKDLPREVDYRFGPLRIDWVDFGIRFSKGKRVNEMEAKNVRDGQVTGTFVQHKPSQSGSIQLPEGSVHLFRDSASKPFATFSRDGALDGAFQTGDDGTGVMLAVLAVPSWMTPSDFLAFVAPALDGMTHLRMIRDSAPNRSIVVIHFSQATDANEFTEVYNGKPFNSMEPEICHVVRVLSVIIDASDTISQAIARVASTDTPGPGSIHELPTCPVCLERMDSAVTGLITVPCSHTFHCMCLSKWGDSRCPICRYSQSLLSSRPAASRNIPFNSARSASAGPTLSTCASCSSTTNLWICLICGNIGCGRYGRAHAHAHYEQTTHLYALELETQRVWDYAGDGYVHRLIQNKADGKLVELPSSVMTSANAHGGGVGPSDADTLGAEKVEAIGIEYSYLLTSQLDSQREYYESMNGELGGRVEELTAVVQRLERDLIDVRAEMDAKQAERGKEAERRVELERGRARVEKRAEKLNDVAKRLEKELREERAVSQGLMKNLEVARGRCEEMEQEREKLSEQVKELEEQVRDVMLFLEARDKINQGLEEGSLIGQAAGGSLQIKSSEEGSGRRKMGKK